MCFVIYGYVKSISAFETNSRFSRFLFEIFFNYLFSDNHFSHV